MNKLTRIAALVATTAVLAGGGIAGTATSASAATIKKHGVVTSKEDSKLHAAVKNQYCVTPTEAKRIVGAKGAYESYGDGQSLRTFKGTGKVKTVWVMFLDGCANWVGTKYTHNRYRDTYNDDVTQRWYANHPDYSEAND